MPCLPFLEMVAVADDVHGFEGPLRHLGLQPLEPSDKRLRARVELRARCDCVTDLALSEVDLAGAPSSRQGAGVVILPLSGAITACFERSVPQHSGVFRDHFGHESLRSITTVLHHHSISTVA